jgi:hypothetical protein
MKKKLDHFPSFHEIESHNLLVTFLFLCDLQIDFNTLSFSLLALSLLSVSLSLVLSLIFYISDL